MSRTTDAANLQAACLPAPALPEPGLPAPDHAGRQRGAPPPPPAAVTHAGTAAPSLASAPPDDAAIAATPVSGPLSLDGELPRLASPPTVTPPAPLTTDHAATAPEQGPGAQPSVSGAGQPSAPASASTPASGETGDHLDQDGPAPDGSGHPMAHMMPAKTAPTEATRKAAELRAARKAKARKIKIGLAAGFVVFAVAVGPFLARWLVDAINEAGSTSTEESAD